MAKETQIKIYVTYLCNTILLISQQQQYFKINIYLKATII